MTDILERAKAVDPEMLAVLNWGALRDLISELIAEVERLRSDWRQEHATAETWKEDFKKMQKRLTDSELLRQAQYNQTAAKDARIKELGSEVERLRSENKIISDRAAHHEKQDAAEIELLAARIKELEALNELNHKNMRSWLDTTTDKEFLDKLSSEIGFKDAYIKRLEAEFLGATKEIVYATHEGRDAPEGEDAYAEKEAREELERIKAETGSGDHVAGANKLILTAEQREEEGKRDA